MGDVDLLLVVGGSVLVATIVSRLQGCYVEGRLTVIDLLAPAPRDPRDQIVFWVLTVGVPFAGGGLVAAWATEKALVAPIATGLGAFMSVDSAFFRPDTLAPPLQDQIRSVRVTYVCFVVACGLLGYLGQSIPALVAKSLHPAHGLNGLTTLGIHLGITLVLIRAANRTANQVIERARRKDEERFAAAERRLAEMLDVRRHADGSSQREGYSKEGYLK